jgi:hypothetical protein
MHLHVPHLQASTQNSATYLRPVVPLNLVEEYVQVRAGGDDDIQQRSIAHTKSSGDDDHQDDDASKKATPANADTNGDDDDDTTAAKRVAQKKKDAKKAAKRAAIKTGHVRMKSGAHPLGHDLCDVGQWYKETSYGNAKCADCPTGYFQTEKNAKSCLICPHGYYQFLGGQENCEKNACKSGHYQGWDKCHSCPAMYYSEKATLFCSACTPGRTSAKGANVCDMIPTPAPTAPTAYPTFSPTPLPWKPPHICKHLRCDMKTGAMVVKSIGIGIAPHQTHKCKYNKHWDQCYCICTPIILDPSMAAEGKWDDPNNDDDGDHSKWNDKAGTRLYPPDAADDAKEELLSMPPGHKVYKGAY